jgi:hypothetical protein
MNEIQPTLFENWVLAEYAVEKGATIQQRFEAFHSANPAIYSLLVRMALDLKRRGFAHYGVAGLFEVIRWEYALRTNDNDFKLNNIYRSRYSRLIMDNEPELAGFFETRTLVSE